MLQNRSLFVRLVSLVLLLAVGLSSAGCSAKSESAQEHFKMAALDGMPAEVKAAPVMVQQSYQFAAANPEILSQMPCYCGCGSMGHTSNYACYVAGEDPSGGVKYDNHALGCSICVDITLDTMRLLEEGKSVAEIRGYVDSTYAQYGPSNIP